MRNRCDPNESITTLGTRGPAIRIALGAIATLVLSGSFTACAPACAAAVSHVVIVYGARVSRFGRTCFQPREQARAAAAWYTAQCRGDAWRSKPSGAIVAGADRIINPDVERWYYARAQSQTVELAGASHAVYESRPKEVAAVIE